MDLTDDANALGAYLALPPNTNGPLDVFTSFPILASIFVIEPLVRSKNGFLFGFENTGGFVIPPMNPLLFDHITPALTKPPVVVYDISTIAVRPA
jgi:hypothetical protein